MYDSLSDSNPQDDTSFDKYRMYSKKGKALIYGLPLCLITGELAELISPTHRMLLLYIVQKCGGISGYCSESTRTIAKLSGLDRAAVLAGIKVLEKPNGSIGPLIVVKKGNQFTANHIVLSEGLKSLYKRQTKEIQEKFAGMDSTPQPGMDSTPDLNVSKNASIPPPIVLPSNEEGGGDTLLREQCADQLVAACGIKPYEADDIVALIPEGREIAIVGSALETVREEEAIGWEPMYRYRWLKKEVKKQVKSDEVRRKNTRLKSKRKGGDTHPPGSAEPPSVENITTEG